MKKLITLLGISFLVVSCYEEDQAVDYDYMNGQTMTFVPSNLGSRVDSVQYYWDETWIASQKEMPFILVYPIQGQTSGNHSLKYIVYSPTGNIIREQKMERWGI